MLKLKSYKKGIIGPVISVFVMVLVISILAGLTFLFVVNLKTQVITTETYSTTVTGEGSAWINSSGYTVDKADYLNFGDLVITSITGNASSDGGYVNGTIVAGNYTVDTSTGVITNATLVTFTDVTISYTFNSIEGSTAYDAVNGTESAGSTVVNYLSLIFLAIIFGAILTLVLRIILPYINLGKQMGGF